MYLYNIGSTVAVFTLGFSTILVVM